MSTNLAPREVLQYIRLHPEIIKRLDIKASDFMVPNTPDGIKGDIRDIANAILKEPAISEAKLKEELGETMLEGWMDQIYGDMPLDMPERSILNTIVDWRVSNLCHSFDNSTDGKEQALQNIINGLNAVKTEISAEVEIVKNAIVDADSFLNADIPTPSELVQGILYQGDKMIISASSKIGKTWFLLRLGLSVSEGLPWLGFKTTKKGVLFVNFELKRHVIQKRIKKIKEEILPNVNVKDFHLLNVREMDLDAGNVVKILADLKDLIAAKNIGMIILDPIYKAYDEDTEENSTGDIANLLKGLERIATATEAAVVFSHHFAKGNQSGKFSIDRSSGAGVYARDPDTIVSITALEDEDGYVVDLCTRAFKQVPSFGIKIREGKVILDKQLDLKNIRRPNGKFSTKYNKEQILTLMEEKPMTQVELGQEANDRYGMSHGSFVAYFKEARKVQGVTENQDRQWSYTKPICNN
jgi:hypothetical protein